MKKTILFLFILLSAKIQAQNLYNISSSSWEQIQSLVKTADGNFCLAGGYGGYLIKIDSLASAQWNYQFSQQTILAITPTVDSGVVIALNTSDSLHIVKMDVNGNLVWVKGRKTTPNTISVNSIAPTLDGGYLFVGGLSTSQAVFTYLYVMKMDSVGNMEWSKIVSIDNDITQGQSILQLGDSSLLLSGYVRDTNYIYHSCLLRLTSTGEILWAKEDTSASGGNFELLLNDTVIYGLIAGYHRNYILSDIDTSSFVQFALSRQTYNNAKKLKILNNGKRAWISSGNGIPELDFMDSTGAISIINTAGTNFITDYSDYAELADGFILISQGMNYGINRLDSMGNGICTFRDSSLMQADSLYFNYRPFSFDTAGTFYSTTIYIYYQSEMFDTTCELDWWGITERNYDESVNVYPNPSLGEVNIDFKDFNNAEKIQVLDALGREIFKADLEEGQTEFKLMTPFNSGYYFIRISSKNRSIIKQIFLQKSN